MNRLDCCMPLTADAGSSTLVHGFGCALFPEGTKLTGAEVAEWRGHPAGANVRAARTDLIPPNPVSTTARTSRRTREVWHTGPHHCPDCAGVE